MRVPNQQVGFFCGGDDIRDEEITKQLMIKGIGQALKAARRIGSWIFKRIFVKVAAMLLPIIAPFIAGLLVLMLIFGFIYFSLFMLPRFIAEGSGGPGVVYNWGMGDIWSLERDAELITRYKDLDFKWTGNFESTNTLTNTRPGISGNGADEDATVGSVWGSYMAVTLSRPNISRTSSYDDLFRETADKYGLDSRLVRALAWAESSFNPTVVSKANCKGLMQLSPDLIKTYGIKDPFNPEENIDGGCRYLKEMLDQFGGNAELAIAAYNAGPNAVARYNGIPPYEETQNHVRKVMAAYTGGKIATPVQEAGSSVMSERGQVEPHRVPWSLLGAIDRVVGDPIIHGKHGPEIVEDQGRIPEPEKHFKVLEPELKWENFQLYYYHKWTVHTTNEDGSTESTTYTEKYTHNIRLLNYANTYEAEHYYTWEEDIIEEESEDDYKKIIVPKLAEYQKKGPYFERLRNLLAEYGLTSDMEVELVLRIAMNMDEQYYIDVNLTSSLMELTGNTEIGHYEGGLGELAWPIRGSITSPYGYRMHPVFKEYRPHTGIDISCPRGAEIRSAGDGIVVFVGNNGAYGKCIMVDHGQYRTLYGHLLSYQIKAGDEVKQGDVIAKADSTGVSTGDHLHFEVRTGVNKTEFIDPMTILK